MRRQNKSHRRAQNQIFSRQRAAAIQLFLLDADVIRAVNSRDYTHLRDNYRPETVRAVLSRHRESITNAGTIR